MERCRLENVRKWKQKKVKCMLEESHADKEYMQEVGRKKYGVRSRWEVSDYGTA